MKTFVIRGLILLASSSLIDCFGYASRWEDDTSIKKVWGGYVLGEEYRTTEPVFIGGTKTAGYSLIAPASLNPSQPPSGDKLMPATIEEYMKFSWKWPEIIGVAEEGTRIRVSHFREWSFFESYDIYVLADIVSGKSQPNDIWESKPKSVWINGMSLPMGGDNIGLWKPNPTVLKPVSK